MSWMVMMGFMRTQKAFARAMMMAILHTSEGWKPRSLPQLKKAVMPPRPAWAISSVSVSSAIWAA